MEPLSTTDTWVGLELRHLVALGAVARTGTFGRAATELGYTQSAVSQQIAALERIVGERVVDRPTGGRAASLTESGETLLSHAAAIMARLAAARSDIAALRAGDAGRLRVGTYQSLGVRLLPAVMGRFLRDWPAVAVGLSEPHTDAELFGQLEGGEIDLAFCSLPLPAGPFAALELLRDPYILLVPSDGPLASREELSLDDLGTTAIVGCDASGARLEDALRAGGHSVEFAFRSDNNATLQSLVAAGYGAALIPFLAVTPGDEERVTVVRLASPVPPRRLAVAWHRDRHRSVAARAFVDLAREASADLQRQIEAAAVSEATTVSVGG